MERQFLNTLPASWSIWRKTRTNQSNQQVLVTLQPNVNIGGRCVDPRRVLTVIVSHALQKKRYLAGKALLNTILGPLQ
jgi:hypothetical protein